MDESKLDSLIINGIHANTSLFEFYFNESDDHKPFDQDAIETIYFELGLNHIIQKDIKAHALTTGSTSEKLNLNNFRKLSIEAVMKFVIFSKTIK